MSRSIKSRAGIKGREAIRNEQGIALIIVMIMIVLVTGLMAMVLGLGGIERNLASLNQHSIQTFQAAGGGNEMSTQVIKDVLLINNDPTSVMSYPGSVVLDTSTAGGNPGLNDFVEELRSGGGILANDTASASPDLVITAMNTQTLNIDIDLEAGGVTLPGSELQEFGIAHHKKIGGTGCPSGNLYSIDTVALGEKKTRANVGTVYFDCP
jgi:hypothetical protein